MEEQRLFKVVDPDACELGEDASHEKLGFKFGERYHAIVRKYGAVELIQDEETGEVTDVAEPHEYLEESDRLALDRHNKKRFTESRFSVTAASLRLLALSQSTFYATQATQLRHEPGYLKECVRAHSLHRPETLPDEQGNAPSPEDLLAKPFFVAQQLRYTIHNTLLCTTEWAVIAQYLQEVADLDAVAGRLGAVEQRKQLMIGIKGLLDLSLESADRRVIGGILHDATVGRFWTRLFDHSGYGGAKVAVITGDNNTKDYGHLLSEKTFKGALVRFPSLDMLTTVSSTWTVERARSDLSEFFLAASAEELGSLSEYLLDALTEWSRLMDFRNMLEVTEPGYISQDVRYMTFATGSRDSQEILTKSFFEKEIKNIESLSKPSIVAKIWKEIDKVAMKKSGRVIEQIIGFAPIAPRWHQPVFVEPKSTAPPPTPPPPTPTPLPNKPIKSKGHQAKPTPRIDPMPAQIRPYWCPVVLPPVVVPVPRQGGEKKTKGTGTETTIASGQTPSTSLNKEDLVRHPIFEVPKRVYDMFERLFSGGSEKGQMSFDDFQYGMTYLDFSMQQRHGSSVVFNPPVGTNNTPFTCHIPHGSKDSLPPVRLRQYACSLANLYGWDLEWFTLKATGTMIPG